jgi:hypothetical protein
MKPPSHTRCDDAGIWILFATAGGENTANIQKFPASANASGQFVITLTSVTNNALIDGIEIDCPLDTRRKRSWFKEVV